MSGEKTSIKGFIADFLTPIITNIGGEPTREKLIKLHRSISGNIASVLSNLGGGRHKHLALKMTSEDYVAHTRFEFVPLHNLDYYPPTIGNARDQGRGSENLRQNQAQFRKYTDVDGALKKQIITAVEPVFLFPVMD